MRSTTRIAGAMLLVLLFASARCTFYSSRTDQKAAEREETTKLLAAQKVIQSRYAPSPELLKVVSNSSHPCLWETTRDTQQCSPGHDCFTVKCRPHLEPKLAQRAIEPEWLIEWPSMVDRPINDDARTMFLRQPQ